MLRCEAKGCKKDWQAGPRQLARRAPDKVPALLEGKDGVLDVPAKRRLPSNTGWRAIEARRSPCT
jgi:hypothetical protein